jgi:D-sedoheptulose 7-phosphate isomerase
VSAPAGPGPGLSATERLQRIAALLDQVTGRDATGRPEGLDQAMERAVGLILAAQSEGRTVMVIGNGGSAAIATHLHNDLVKAIGVRALAFVDAPLLTALGNDHGYAAVYHRPLELWARPGDVLLAISSSGRSENILRAVASARARSCHVITISGFAEDNPLRAAGDVNLHVATTDYGEVEAVHSVLAHALTDLVLHRLHDEPPHRQESDQP